MKTIATVVLLMVLGAVAATIRLRADPSSRSNSPRDQTQAAPAITLPAERQQPIIVRPAEVGPGVFRLPPCHVPVPEHSERTAHRTPGGTDF